VNTLDISFSTFTHYIIIYTQVKARTHAPTSFIAYNILSNSANVLNNHCKSKHKNLMKFLANYFLWLKFRSFNYTAIKINKNLNKQILFIMCLCTSKMVKVFEVMQSKRNTSDFDRHGCEARRTLIPAIKRNLSDRRDDRTWLWLRMISRREESEAKERTTQNRCINMTSNATRQSARHLRTSLVSLTPLGK